MYERIVIPPSLLECTAGLGLLVFAERDPQWDFISRQTRETVLRWYATTGHWSDCHGNTGKCRDPWSIAYMAGRLIQSRHAPTIPGQPPKRGQNGTKNRRREGR